jgi:hypothetical protein
VQLQAIHGQLEATLRLAAATLRRCEVSFMLGGSMASWARGGPLSRKDIDLYVKPEDAERTLEALVGAGMRAESSQRSSGFSRRGTRTCWST